MGAEKMIESWQIKKLWTVSRALGLDREEFHRKSFEDCGKLFEKMKRYVATANRKAGDSG